MSGIDVAFRIQAEALGVTPEELSHMTIAEVHELGEKTPSVIAERERARLAVAYVEANRSSLRSSAALTIRCPRRHAVARVFSTRWGPFLDCVPGTMTPRDRLYDVDGQAVDRRDWPTFSGLLRRDVAASVISHSRGACRCSVWSFKDSDVHSWLALGTRDHILDPDNAWRGDIS